MGWGFGSLKNNYEMGCISMMKKYSVRSLVLAFCLCFMVAMPAWAAVDSTAQIGGSTVHQMLPYPPELPSEKDTIKPYGTEPSAQGWDFAKDGIYDGRFSIYEGPIYTNKCFYIADMYWCRIACSGEDAYIPFSLCNYCVTCGRHIKTVNSYETPKTWGHSIDAIEKMYAGNSHAGHYLCPYIDKEYNGLRIGGTIYVNNKNEW